MVLRVSSARCLTCIHLPQVCMQIGCTARRTHVSRPVLDVDGQGPEPQGNICGIHRHCHGLFLRCWRRGRTRYRRGALPLCPPLVFLRWLCIDARRTRNTEPGSACPLASGFRNKKDRTHATKVASSSWIRFVIALSRATNIATSECSISPPAFGYAGRDCSNRFKNPRFPFSSVPVGHRFAHPRRIQDEQGNILLSSVSPSVSRGSTHRSHLQFSVTIALHRFKRSATTYLSLSLRHSAHDVIWDFLPLWFGVALEPGAGLASIALCQ